MSKIIENSCKYKKYKKNLYKVFCTTLKTKQLSCFSAKILIDTKIIFIKCLIYITRTF